MDVVTIILGGAILFLLLLAWHLTKTRGHLEAMGIPVVKPQGLLASAPHDLHNHVLHEVTKYKFGLSR